MSINDYTGNQFEIMDDYENRSGSLCPPCCFFNTFYSAFVSRSVKNTRPVVFTFVFLIWFFIRNPISF